MDKEIWKSIRSFPELEASSDGRVRCIPYSKQIGNGAIREYGGKPTFGSFSHNGRGQRRHIYMFRRRPLKVARLVCEAFHGVAPPNKTLVLHIDEDSRNNRPENLKWGTHKENQNYPKLRAMRMGNYMGKLRDYAP